MTKQPTQKRIPQKPIPDDAPGQRSVCDFMAVQAIKMMASNGAPSGMIANCLLDAAVRQSVDAFGADKAASRLELAVEEIRRGHIGG